MKKVNWYYKFLIVIIIFFSMFIFLTKNMSNIINSSSYKGYMNYIGIPINSIKKYNIFNNKNLVKENQKLEKKLIELETNNNENQSLKDEIQELKETMNLKKTYSSYDIIYSKTINRNKMYWYSTITIDKGVKDGIKVGDAVVNYNGLIGIIKSTNKSSSSVKLITNSDKDNKISVMVNAEGKTKIGNIEGYEYPYIIVSLATDKTGIKEGDKLITSGLGSLPKNLYIGEIKLIKTDDFNLSNILYVEPKQDMNNINYVAVLSLK